MKNYIKRITALLVTLLLCMSLVPVASASSFSDITDSADAENVEVLRMMGVLNGRTETTFVPDGTLRRAEFCKMAITLMGRGDQVGSYKNFTIFPDVKGSHWAAGYVNMAVRGEQKFITGFTDGTFRPDQNITYGQAVTILMRLLGYTDADVGIVWPEGYLNAAAENGLTKGLSLSGNSAITRAQAAKLFVNLLNTDTKSGSSFLSSVGTAVSDVILLSANAVDDNGAPAMLTSEGTFPLAGSGSAFLSGRKGTVLLNSAGKALTFIPTNVGQTRDISIASASADTITDTAGVKYKVYSDTLTYFNNEKGTYGTDRVFFRAGTLATVYIGATGKVEYVVVGSAASDEAVIVTADGSNALFNLLTERTDYQIYKNGEKVSVEDLRKNDVATYSAANNTVYVSDSRLRVYYKNAYPNTEAPTTITVTGISEPLSVLRSAADSLDNYDLGDSMTLLLTYDGRVAGTATGNRSGANAVGYATADSVELFNGMVIDCDLPDMSDFAGKVVSVTGADRNKVSLRALSGSISGSLDVAKRTVGNAVLAGNARIYEKVGAGALREISLADIPVESVSNSQIAYGRKNYAGKVDVLVLEDVTGGCYTYGRMSVEMVDSGSVSGYRNRCVTVHSGDGKSMGPLICSAFSDGEWGGIAAETNGNRAAGFVNLRELRKVPAAAWRSEALLYLDGTAYTVSKDIVCYNAIAGVWFNDLSAALAFGHEVSVYVDSGNVVRGLEVKR